MYPLCRYLLVCMAGHRTDPGERGVLIAADGTTSELTGDEGGDVLLVNPVDELDPPPGMRYPAMHDNVFLFAHLAGGIGPHELVVELVRWHLGCEYVVFRKPGMTFNFGSDPTVVIPLHYRLVYPIIFPVAAQYSFRLFCDGRGIGQTEIELRSTP